MFWPPLTVQQNAVQPDPHDASGPHNDAYAEPGRSRYRSGLTTSAEPKIAVRTRKLRRVDVRPKRLATLATARSPSVRSFSAAVTADVQVGEHRVDLGDDARQVRAAPGDDVETERATVRREELLAAELTRQADVASASNRTFRPPHAGIALRREQRSCRATPGRTRTARRTRRANASSGVTPPPKSSRCSGRAKLARCTTECVCSVATVVARRWIRPSQPAGRPTARPWAASFVMAREISARRCGTGSDRRARCRARAARGRCAPRAASSLASSDAWRNRFFTCSQFAPVPSPRTRPPVRRRARSTANRERGSRSRPRSTSRRARPPARACAARRCSPPARPW